MEHVNTTPPLAGQKIEQTRFIDEKELLTRVPVSRRTLYSWVESGKLPCIKMNRRKLYHWASVEAALLCMQYGGLE